MNIIKQANTVCLMHTRQLYLDELLQVVVASPEAANLCLAFGSEAIQMLLVPRIHCTSIFYIYDE